MFSWATNTLERLAQTVAPPATDASSRFVYCCRSGDEAGAMAAAKELPGAGCIVNAVKGQCPLHVACFHGMLSLTQELLQQPGASVEMTDAAGNTALHCAAMSEQAQALSMVQYLVTTCQASVTAKNSMGQSPYDVGVMNTVRQYLLPLQLQKETQEALDNGGHGLPPGIDLGGLKIKNVNLPPPPLQMGIPSFSQQQQQQQQQGGGYTSPYPAYSPSQQQQQQMQPPLYGAPPEQQQQQQMQMQPPPPQQQLQPPPHQPQQQQPQPGAFPMAPSAFPMAPPQQQQPMQQQQQPPQPYGMYGQPGMATAPPPPATQYPPQDAVGDLQQPPSVTSPGQAPPESPQDQPEQQQQRGSSAPNSGGISRDYERVGYSSAAIYKPTGGGRTFVKPDGFHSSSSDKKLQEKYGHHAPNSFGSGAAAIPPPPSSGNSSGMMFSGAPGAAQGPGPAPNNNNNNNSSSGAPNPFAGGLSALSGRVPARRYVAYDPVSGQAAAVQPSMGGGAVPRPGVGTGFYGGTPPVPNFSTFIPGQPSSAASAAAAPSAAAPPATSLYQSSPNSLGQLQHPRQEQFGHSAPPSFHEQQQQQQQQFRPSPRQDQSPQWQQQPSASPSAMYGAPPQASQAQSYYGLTQPPAPFQQTASSPYGSSQQQQQPSPLATTSPFAPQQQQQQQQATNAASLFGYNPAAQPPGSSNNASQQFSTYQEPAAHQTSPPFKSEITSPGYEPSPSFVNSATPPVAQPFGGGSGTRVSSGGGAASLFSTPAPNRHSVEPLTVATDAAVANTPASLLATPAPSSGITSRSFAYSRTNTEDTVASHASTLFSRGSDAGDEYNQTPTVPQSISTSSAANAFAAMPTVVEFDATTAPGVASGSAHWNPGGQVSSAAEAFGSSPSAGAVPTSSEAGPFLQGTMPGDAADNLFAKPPSQQAATLPVEQQQQVSSEHNNDGPTGDELTDDDDDLQDIPLSPSATARPFSNKAPSVANAVSTVPGPSAAAMFDPSRSLATSGSDVNPTNAGAAVAVTNMSNNSNSLYAAIGMPPPPFPRK